MFAYSRALNMLAFAGAVWARAMFVPCGTNSLPARLSVRVISARGLPVMDKSNVTTDAFVEVHFDNEVYKTDVCSKSLSPVWNSDEFVFETDEQRLFDNPIQFRVMDHDTYSANDAIGRKYLRSFAASVVPATLAVSNIVGLVSDIASVSDPEYEWFDRIRTPRASNEARQSMIRKSLRELARNIAQKAHSLGSNAVIGYQEFVDIEGDATELITFRAFGTAVKLVQNGESAAVDEKITQQQQQILSINTLPETYRYEYGVVVCARSAQLLTDDSDSGLVRKRWWNELKAELLRQASSLRCNLVLGYTEQISVRKKTALLSCTGTAVSVVAVGNEHIPNCIRFHSACFDDSSPMGADSGVCSYCNDAVCPSIILSTCSPPSSDYLQGATHPLQAYVTRELSSSESDEQLVYTISHMLPFLEHELFNRLMEEVRSGGAKYNAVFDLKSVMVIHEGVLFAVCTGTLCTLKALLKPPDADNILSRSDSLHYRGDLQPKPSTSRVGLLEAARILRAPKSSDKVALHLQPFQIREPVDDCTKGSQQSHYMKRMFRRFRKKVVDRDHLAKMISEREVSLQLGAFDDMKPASSSPSTYSGIKIINGSKFTLSTASAKASNLPQRYAGILIREVTRTIEDIADLDAFLEGAFRDLVCLAVSQVETVGATSFSVFRVPSMSLSICRDQASILLFITADFDYLFT
ncbi:unnamed protein product [Gongylonema pulchrum]|uniref:C2 domain-containing protein n=1 Tax=Gongylonema pulchrum TaxID=637853 RepID=A0A183E4C6_9BILA|nr:unnamed protein product [Gongylonema pulchrum]